MKLILPITIAVFTLLAKGDVKAQGNPTPPCRARTLDLRADTAVYGPGVWGGPAFFHGMDKKSNEIQYVFYCGSGHSIRAFSLSNGTLTQTGKSARTYGNGGTTPVVTSNNQTPSGSEIVWAVDRAASTGPQTVHLHAYCLSNLM